MQNAGVVGVTLLNFSHQRDVNPASFERADPDAGLIERTAWNRWLVTPPDGEHVHGVRLEKRNGAFVGECRLPEDDVEQGIDADPNDKFSEIILKILGAVVEMELHLNRERRQEGIERAIDRGVQFGQAPHGMTKNEMGVAVPGEGYERVRAVIREVPKGRPKRPTARFFDVPEGSIATILDRAEELYGIEFDDDEWKIERARVETAEKELDQLGGKQ